MTELKPGSEAGTTEASRTNRVTGVGRLLILVYGVLALASTGRSFVQIFEPSVFGPAPLAYSLSALAAVVYIGATVALVKRSEAWNRVAWATISFELLGVLVIGTLSLTDPALFQHKTVWSVYGMGYGFVPLVLPILGIWWLRKHPVTVSRTAPASSGA
jgi:hypothetical protein